MKSFDLDRFREQFPLLSQSIKGQPLVYFDNAATTQKPHCVIDTQQAYYQQYNANVHRAAHHLSAQATKAFEQARMTVQSFIGAKYAHEIIWTKGTTESINLVAQSWGSQNLSAGDEIVLSFAEHHANIVPWQVIAKKIGAVIKVMPLNEQGVIDESALEHVITRKTKVVCCAHISNVIGKLNPIKTIIAFAKRVGAVTLIDGAQSIAHTAVDVQALGCDFYVFSAHKMYGPTGVGALYGKTSLLENMPVYQSGGEMIDRVSFSGTTFNKLPFKFEAGTPNIAGVIGFARAVKFIQDEQLITQTQYKQQLIDYCYQALLSIEELNFIVKGKPGIPLFAFTLDNHHQQDIAIGLDNKGIAVRVGHHCAMPLMEQLKINGCIRVSLALYNSFAEVDNFITQLKQLIKPDEAEDSILALTGKDEINDATQQILTLFSKAKSWDSKHREIMLLGKKLTRMDKSLRNDDTLISGCESAAWLKVNKTAQGIYHFKTDSDAKIIRGLLFIVLSALNNKTAQQIIAFDMHSYFDKLGLLQHLSPSRGNGLLAIVEKIRQSVSA